MRVSAVSMAASSVRDIGAAETTGPSAGWDAAREVGRDGPGIKGSSSSPLTYRSGSAENAIRKMSEWAAATFAGEENGFADEAISRSRERQAVSGTVRHPATTSRIASQATRIDHLAHLASLQTARTVSRHTIVAPVVLSENFNECDEFTGRINPI
ncbi:MAG: hypothetical protein ACC645_02235 [Pirellulales bacterium]